MRAQRPGIPRPTRRRLCLGICAPALQGAGSGRGGGCASAASSAPASPRCCCPVPHAIALPRDTIYWSFSSCEGSDMWYWAVEALDALAARGVNTSAYQYK